LSLRPEEKIMAHLPSPTHRRVPRRPVWLAALALLTFPAWPFADPPPAAPARAAQTATDAPASADLVSEFQQLEAAAHGLDPAAPDAIARLRVLVERLAHADGQLAREVARMRAAEEVRAAAPAVVAPRGRKSAPASPRAGTAGSPATGPAAGAAGESVPNAPFFARRGLRKFHRAGCVFGERIHADDRVGYPSAAAALAAGLEPCKVCRPE
jgi:hypothetical protein